MDFSGKTIAIGITGSIAAYRSCDLIRELYRRGAKKVVALTTPSASKFIPNLTLQSLTRHPVSDSGLSITPDGTPEHIAIAQTADALLIHPATTNTIAQLAHGMADDAVTTAAITFTGKPILIAPAMNTRMWKNPLTQRNITTLEALENITIIRPIEGDLACGETGAGHLADQETVLQQLYKATHPDAGLLQGINIVVTAGGTQEAIDPVRHITNHSSGKMGVAFADECFAMGANVTLIVTNSVHIENLEQRAYSIVRADNVNAMHTAVHEQFTHADLLIMAAAVSDFAPVTQAEKIKRNKNESHDKIQLELTPTPDILASITASKKPGQYIVGFAAESQNLLTHAQGKLERKQLDAIIANDISQPGIGFQSDENEATLLFNPIYTHEQTLISKRKKYKLAQAVMQQLCHHFFEKPAKRLAHSI